jgi:hypothetical protein
MGGNTSNLVIIERIAPLQSAIAHHEEAAARLTAQLREMGVDPDAV